MCQKTSLRASISWIVDAKGKSLLLSGAFQLLVGEHSVAGVPESLYNPTKSVPDPSG